VFFLFSVSQLEKQEEIKSSGKFVREGADQVKNGQTYRKYYCTKSDCDSVDCSSEGSSTNTSKCRALIKLKIDSAGKMVV